MIVKALWLLAVVTLASMVYGVVRAALCDLLGGRWRCPSCRRGGL